MWASFAGHRRLFFKGLSHIPAFSHCGAQRPVLDSGHVEEQRPHPGDIDFTVLDHILVSIGLNQFADEDVMR
jgi:hypothetical protein